METASTLREKRKDGGYVLLVVVIFSFTLFALATTYVGKTMSDRTSSMNEIRRMQATELARAGVELGRDRIAREQAVPGEDLSQDLPTGSVRVRAATCGPTQGCWKLSSTGFVPSATQANATATVTAWVGSSPEDATGASPRILAYLEGEMVEEVE